MPKNRAGRDIWYERDFLRLSPITNAGLAHTVLTIAVALGLGTGGGWLIEQPSPVLRLTGVLLVIAFPVWGVVNLIVAYRHSGPWGSSWKN